MRERRLAELASLLRRRRFTMDGQKTALICGISGQDGSYLARHLLEKGYRVAGTSRDAQLSPFTNLATLGIRDKVELHSMSLNDFRSVLQVLTRVRPDEIYNLAGQTSVFLSFEQPVETLESITIASVNLLESIRFIGQPVRLYDASSSECFGNTGGAPANEETPFRPASPYAVAKAASFWEVANYRSAYGLFACSGILFNHESPLRPERFVTRKIVEAARRIGSGSPEVLKLGDLDVERDWGWAPEYVDAMWRILQAGEARDYVIATGEKHSVRQFADEAFRLFGVDLQWEGEGASSMAIERKTGRTIIQVDPQFIRPLEVRTLVGDPSRAARELGWKATTRFSSLIAQLAG
jgi:GDPmannose 4,6-dehydratase